MAKLSSWLQMLEKGTQKLNEGAQKLNDGAQRMNAASQRYLEKTKLRAKYQTSADIEIKTEGFIDELEREVMLEAAVAEEQWQHELAMELRADPLVAELFPAAYKALEESILKGDSPEAAKGLAAKRHIQQLSLETAKADAERERKFRANPELRKHYEAALKFLREDVANE